MTFRHTNDRTQNNRQLEEYNDNYDIDKWGKNQQYSLINVL